MTTVLLIIHILVAIGIIVLVLLQQGKGADMGAAFGAGGSSGSVFGATGSANFLSKMTAALATVFFLSSLGLTYFASHSQKADSVMNQVKVKSKAEPAKPAAQPVPSVTPQSETVAPKAKDIPN